MIRNPESTKNTSTPTNPPLRRVTPACTITTIATAMPRSPSISGRKTMVCPVALRVFRTGHHCQDSVRLVRVVVISKANKAAHAMSTLASSDMRAVQASGLSKILSLPRP